MATRLASASRQDRAAYRRASRASMIIPVKRFEVSDSVHVADVERLDVLVDVAEAYETMLLEISSRRGTTFLVCNGGVLFRYVVHATAPLPPLEAPLADAGAIAAAPVDDAVGPTVIGLLSSMNDAVDAAEKPPPAMQERRAPRPARRTASRPPAAQRASAARSRKTAESATASRTTARTAKKTTKKATKATPPERVSGRSSRG